MPQYLFRGHRRNDWLLEPTLVRLLKTRKNPKDLYSEHLMNFRYALRGRRGPNPPPLGQDYDAWALGQHNGLATPLLDWTASPYAALFFAFAENKPNDATKTRAVFCLNEKRITELSGTLKIDPANADDVIEFHRPMSDENARLVNQAGLFSVSTGVTDIESWIRNHWDPTERKVVLLKIYIPDRERIACLKALNKMNINYASLFPDMYGACMHANMKLEVPKY